MEKKQLAIGNKIGNRLQGIGNIKAKGKSLFGRESTARRDRLTRINANEETVRSVSLRDSKPKFRPTSLLGFDQGLGEEVGFVGEIVGADQVAIFGS